MSEETLGQKAAAKLELFIPFRQNKPYTTTLSEAAKIIDDLAAQQPCGCEKLREALQWAMDKEPSPCRCLQCATPPHVCIGHKALAQPCGCQQATASVGSEWTNLDGVTIEFGDGETVQILERLVTEKVVEKHNAALRRVSMPTVEAWRDLKAGEERNGDRRIMILIDTPGQPDRWIWQRRVSAPQSSDKAAASGRFCEVRDLKNLPTNAAYFLPLPKLPPVAAPDQQEDETVALYKAQSEFIKIHPTTGHPAEFRLGWQAALAYARKAQT